MKQAVFASGCRVVVPDSFMKGCMIMTLVLVCTTRGWAEDPLRQKALWQRHIPAVPAGVTPIESPPVTPREHVQVITEGAMEYTINMAGTMDGPSTRMPRGYAAWNQVFQPMQFVRLENTGESDLINPRLVVNGKRQWWTVRDFIDSAYLAYGNPASHADKVRAIYEYYVAHRFHGTSHSSQNDDAIRALHIFGYTLCNNDGWILSHIYDVAGFGVRSARPVGHVSIEVFYDDRWHLLDADQNMYFLLPDNQTLAGNNDIARDHDLVKRTHSYGINFPDDRARDEASASFYYQEHDVGSQPRSRTDHTMQMTLRPGEALEWRYQRREGEVMPETRRPKIYAHGSDLGPTQGASAGLLMYNGKWIYDAPLRNAAARRIHHEQNIAWADGQGEPALRAASAEQPAYVVWRVASPYVMVGGSVHAQTTFDESDNSELAISFDQGETWEVVDTWAAGEQPGEWVANLDRLFPPQLPGMARHLAARYDYLLRLTLPQTNVGQVGINAITIDNDLQMAPLSLPELELGDNLVTYTDESSGDRSMTVTFDWVESSATAPPAAPAGPIFPQDGAQVEGTQVVFRWKPAAVSGGAGIADYQFQLSDRPDMLWPLSPNFHKLSTNTSGAELEMFTTPYEGLLNGGQRYYWRVRALSDRGVWGPWSETWSFVPQAPRVPLEVTVAAHNDGTVTLAWRPNPDGARPGGYEIHASNERGFTVRHEPHPVHVGGAEGSLFEGQFEVIFDATLIDTVSGASVTLRPAHAHYRIVAVDERGNRSGASDFVEVPRPLIFTEPVRATTVGQRYTYAIRSVASIGDLRNTNQGRGFWDVETAVYTLVEGPEWLSLDAETGVLTGTPPASGRFSVEVQAHIEGQDRAAEQTFVIEVER